MTKHNGTLSETELHTSSSTNTLSLLLWNARSINNQINPFQSFIYTENYDVIAITETWLQNFTYSNEILPTGYTIIRKDRDSKGGGVLLACKDSMNIKQLHSPSTLEAVTVEIDSSFVLCLIYRPPNSDDQNNSLLLSYLNSLVNTKNIIIIGDLNLPEVDWNTYSGHSPFSEEFMDLAFNLNLTQLVTGPTHCAGNTLDIALTNFDGLQHVETCSSLPTNMSSDHYMLIFTLEHCINDHVRCHTTRFDYNHADWHNMNQFLYQYDFTLALSSNNTEFIWSYIKTAINSAADLFIPKIQVNSNTQQPQWFNPPIRHKIKCLRTMKRKYSNHPTDSNERKVANLQKELQMMIAQAKSDHESNLILSYAHSNNNKIFQYISSLKGNDNYPSQMFYNDKQASTNQDKAQLFNDYFYSVFTHSSDSIPDQPDSTPNSDTLHNIEILSSEVFDLLTNLDTNKACGIDNISPKLLRYCASPLLQVICHLFTISLSNSTIPKDWRTHNIVPVYKSGEKSSICNYRPISLLCVLSKVLERIVYNYMIDHIEGKLTKHQFGFLPKRSTLQQLLLFTHEVLETKNETDVIYMDFKKAFDSVSHNGLLRKLNTIGITGKLWSWLKEYLLRRFQSVKIGDSLSPLCSVLSGVPQGSVLGPLLFAIFINNLPDCIRSAIPFIFADDTKCLLKVKSSEDVNKLQKDIDNAAEWSQSTDLLFNEAKFAHVRYWARPTFDIDSTTYLVNGKPIKQFLQHKDLGITFSSDLNWTTHYKNITAKAYQTLGLIRRTFKTDCINAKKQLYIALIRSQLMYCSQLWRPQLIKDITTLERVQRRATKYILNDFSSSYKSRLQQLHLLPLMYIYELNDLMFLVKSIKSPVSNFDIRQHITFTTNNTRSGSHLKLVHPRTLSAVQSHFYFNRITRLWNHLPVIDLSAPLHVIKKQITQYLWNHFTTNFTSDNICTLHILCPCHRCSRLPITTNFRHLS